MFLVNVPLCALLVVAALRWIPSIRPDPGRGFDVLGAVLTTLGVGSLAFALIEAQDRGWGSALVVGALGRLGPAAARTYVDGLHDALWVSGLALLAAAALVAVLVPRHRQSDN